MSGYSGKFSGPVGFTAQRSLLIRACGGDSTKKRWNPKQTKSLKALNEGGSVNRMARRNELDDRYAINAAQTELHGGYKNADVERILSVADVQLPSYPGAKASRIFNLARSRRVFTKSFQMPKASAVSVTLKCSTSRWTKPAR